MNAPAPTAKLTDRLSAPHRRGVKIVAAAHVMSINYEQIVADAVAALAHNTPDARREVYGAARATVARHLQLMRLPAPVAELERLSLDLTIKKIERDARARETARRPAPPRLQLRPRPAPPTGSVAEAWRSFAAAFVSLGWALASPAGALSRRAVGPIRAARRATSLPLSRFGSLRFGLSRRGLSRLGLSRLGLSRLGLSCLGLSRLGLSRLGLAAGLPIAAVAILAVYLADHSGVDHGLMDGALIQWPSGQFADATQASAATLGDRRAAAPGAAPTRLATAGTAAEAARFAGTTASGSAATDRDAPASSPPSSTARSCADLPSISERITCAGAKWNETAPTASDRPVAASDRFATPAATAATPTGVPPAWRLSEQMALGVPLRPAGPELLSTRTAVATREDPASWQVPAASLSGVTGAPSGSAGAASPAPPDGAPDATRSTSPKPATPAGGRVEALIDSGRRWVLKGDLDHAARDFTEAIRADPKIPEPYYERGQVLFKMGETERSIADYAAALQRDPQSGAALRARGMAYLYRGSADLALTDISAAIDLAHAGRLPPLELFYALRSRANIYESKLQYDLEIADLTTIIDGYADDPALVAALKENYQDGGAANMVATVYRQRATAYIRQSKWERAVADLTAAIPLSVDHGFAALLDRAKLREALGQRDQAVADLQAAIGIRPGSDEVRLALRRLGAVPRPAGVRPI